MIDPTILDKKRVYDELAEQLLNTCHAEMAFPLSQKEFSCAAGTFFQFLALPQETKDTFFVKPTDDPRDSGVGYVRKVRAEGERDNKEYFHYHPSIEKEYFAPLLKEDDEVTAQFFDSARTIFNAAETTLSDIMDALETEHPGIRQKIFPLSEKWGSVLRFLKYDVAGMGNFLAKGHYDMGACTLALAESASGLRVGSNTDDLQPVTRKGDTTFFIGGYNFPHITNNTFKPTWHDVVQDSEKTFNDDTARWAIVFFVGAIDLPLPSLSETHSPSK